MHVIIGIIQITTLLCALTTATASLDFPTFEKLEVDPDLNRDTMELITSKGYPAEKHNVTTSDGYIVELHRIPSAKDITKGVVFLQHGLLGSSADWIMNQPDQSLGFILADAGFDVWMGNVRGNTYSWNHTRFTPSEKKFWDFSHDEQAKYDLPAMIDYVLLTTEEEQLVYIGYSQGTQIGFAGFSSQPELAAKVKLFIALAPVARLGNIQFASIVRPLFNRLTVNQFNLLGAGGEFLRSSELIDYLATQICTRQLIGTVCSNIVTLLSKYHNASRIPVYLSHFPAGTSQKNMIHFLRLVATKKFQKYDYTKFGNLRHYGKLTPPIYKISDMTVKTATFSGGNDGVANPTDVAWILSQLKQHVFHKTIDDYGHGDFIWATNAATVLFSDVLNVINNHS